jgi:hypothetical protein
LPVPYQRRRLPESGLGETTLHTEGGHFFQDGATEGPEDRRRDADANIIFQVGPHQVLIGTAPDLCSVLV